MIRGWAYATLIVALVVGCIATPNVTPTAYGRSEIVESGPPPTSALQKRSSKQNQVARRDAGDSPLVIVSEPDDLARPRVEIVDGIEPTETQTKSTTVLATARAPPT